MNKYQYLLGRKSTGCAVGTIIHPLAAQPRLPPRAGGSAAPAMLLLLQKAARKAEPGMKRSWERTHETRQVCAGGSAPFQAALHALFSSFLLSSAAVVCRTEIPAGIGGVGAPWHSSGCSLPRSPHSCCCRETTKCEKCSFSPQNARQVLLGTPRGLRRTQTGVYSFPQDFWIPSPTPFLGQHVSVSIPHKIFICRKQRL